MVDGGDVLCRHTYLDHLQLIRRLKHTVPDLRRLGHTITGIENEWLTLVFVDKPYPALVAIDQLKPDHVIVHHVRHRPAGRNANVRRNDAATEAAWNEVAVMHASAADDPGCTVHQAPHHILLRGYGCLGHRRQRAQFNTVATGRGEFGCTVCQGPAVGQYAHRCRGFGRTSLQPQEQPLTRDQRNAWIVSRVDFLEPEAKRLLEELHLGQKVRAREPHFRT